MNNPFSYILKNSFIFFIYVLSLIQIWLTFNRKSVNSEIDPAFQHPCKLKTPF